MWVTWSALDGSISKPSWTLTEKSLSISPTRRRYRPPKQFPWTIKCCRSSKIISYRCFESWSTEVQNTVAESSNIRLTLPRYQWYRPQENQGDVPQTNGICERFHKTILSEFYQVTFRKKLYGSLEELQRYLDKWTDDDNNHRTHQGKMYCGRTPIETLENGKSIWAEKI